MLSIGSLWAAETNYVSDRFRAAHYEGTVGVCARNQDTPGRTLKMRILANSQRAGLHWDCVP